MPRRRVPRLESEVTLPITPMLDMAFQLLAFFVFTFNPSALEEGAIDLNLPAAGMEKAPTIEQVQSPDADVELPKDVDVTVRVRTQAGGRGEITGIEVEYLRPAAKVVIEGNDEDEFIKNLRNHLTEKHASLVNKDDIKIEAAANLKNGRLLKVVDACTLKGAGFKKVSFAPPPSL
jgi:biopolymer transport protein ExbD